MHWTNSYIGIPYSNMNCVEFVLCVEREVFNRKFPHPVRPTERNPFHYNRLLQENMMNYISEPKLDKPVEGCCVLMKAMNRLNHVGVFVKIKSKEYVLHSLDSFKSSILHQVKDLPKYGITVEGYYSWK